MAVLGEHDESCRLARELVLPARTEELPFLARMAHLAYGLSLRAAGAPDSAERELVAAEELCRHGGRTDERLIIRYELGIQVAERIRGAVHDSDFQHVAPGLVVTVSVGVAAMDPD